MNYDLSPFWTTVLVIAAMWELIWKGLALWKAARNNHSGWFIAILIINSIGILPIIYLLTHRDAQESPAVRSDTDQPITSRNQGAAL